MTMDAYFKQIKGKKLAVIGMGVSNIPLIKLLLERNMELVVCDKKPRSELGPIADELESLGAEFQLGGDYLSRIHKAEIIFRTPGLHPDTPELKAAAAGGAELTSEMELFFKVCPAKIIGVTGSDGKTTTSTLIDEILKKSGRRSYLGGNIGRPLLPLAGQMSGGDIAVLELSSFQLMTMKQSPDIAVITNISPNHLDVHKSFDEYVRAKERIFMYQAESKLLVLNAGDGHTAEFESKAKAKILKFSSGSKPENGVYLKSGLLYRVKDGAESELFGADQIALRGAHNLENVMAAICALDGLAEDEAILELVREFQGVEHRIEFVRTVNGVSYYNDSIASSPSRTIAGLKSFDERLILIAGGYDKNIPYDVLGPYINDRVKVLILSGASSAKIRRAVEQAANYSPETLEIRELEDFYETVPEAARLAKPGDVVLFSPASASFDRFKNFMERGAAFKKAVLEL